MPSSTKTAASILYLSEDSAHSKSFTDSLAQESYAVRQLPYSNTRVDPSALNSHDLLIVDMRAVSFSDVSLYTKVRQHYSGLILLLLDSVDEMLQILLYEQGVDDLLTKPLTPLLLLARIRALFRRTSRKVQSSVLLFNGLEINSGMRRALFQGEEIPLTAREFDLLWYLARNACTTLNRDHLYKAVFGLEYNGYDRSVDMYIARLRAKMSPYPNLPQLIKTVRGNGYLFAAEN